MPWTAKDAYSHTKKANTPALQAQWSTIANSHLERTGDEAAAIRMANDAVANKPTKKTFPPKKAPSDGEVNPRTELPGMAGPQPLSGGE